METYSDSAMVIYMKNVLKLSIQGDLDNYNKLVSVFHHDRRLGPDNVAALVTCLEALSGAVSCINMVRHQSLVNSIYSRTLWDYETDVMDALVELLLSLASCSGHVDLCLNMLVTDFFPPPYIIRKLNESRFLTRKKQVLDRVHLTFDYIAELVPLSPMRLEEIVLNRKPICCSRLDFEVMMVYVENILRLEKGPLGKLIGQTMLAVIVDILVDLDLNIERVDIPEDCLSQFRCDIELGEIGLDAEHESEKTRELCIQNPFERKKSVMMLDNILVLTFEHLKSCYESGRLTQVFEILLRFFEKTVITAYKSKFAQFVFFYACSLDPVKCGEKFATRLLNIFFDSVSPHRMNAVAYLASYLSRAKFMSSSFTVTVLESLAKWCSNYCKNQGGDINFNLHDVFYAGCQAIMYLLCFRMRSMVLIPRLKLRLRLLNLEEILRHPLSPLKACLPSIVEEFLHTVRETQLFTVPETQEDFGSVARLDMFFPFDPYLLKESDSFIRPNYVYWSMVESTLDDDDDEEEDSTDEDIAEVGEGDEGIDMVGGGRSFEDEFDYSFDNMSITPKEYFLHRCEARIFHMQMPSKIRPSTSPRLM